MVNPKVGEKGEKKMNREKMGTQENKKYLNLIALRNTLNVNVLNIHLKARVFSDHNSMKLEINLRKRTEKKMITWRVNSMLLKSQCISNEIKEEI